MKVLTRIFPWQRILYLTVAVVSLLTIFSFYGLYSNQFYFLEPFNYVFPLLATIHLIFLYVVWFKIGENEVADLPMRNLEYALYAVLLFYVYKFFETLYILMSYSMYEDHVLPGTFFPIGIFILCLQVALIGMTLMVFHYRRERIGDYNFDDIQGHIDTWE